MKVGLFTREYQPQVYGGAGVHVDYLSRELAKEIEVEVHCWGPQQADDGNLHVRGAEPWAEISNGTEGKFKGALEALSLNLTQIKALEGIDIVHTHTWYVSMAGFLAKKLYGVPFVLTTHSLEPLRAWKAEQLGSGYAMSSWMERTAILDADAIIAAGAPWYMAMFGRDSLIASQMCLLLDPLMATGTLRGRVDAAGELVGGRG